MKAKLLFLFSFIVAALCSVAQDNVTDSVDVLHYDLRLDIGNHTAKRIEGSATVTMRVLSEIDAITLEICPSNIDSVWMNGIRVAYSYDTAGRLLHVPFGGDEGDTVQLTVFYRKGQHVMPQGWGGFYFDNNIYYNLGIAIYEYPHNAGKAWFPCRDNFYDRATYTFQITAQAGWKAICTGLLDTVLAHADGSSTWCWNLQRATPTYLVGVAVAPFHIIERYYESHEATYPAIIGFLDHDSTNVWKAFNHMSKVIPFYEQCFGPYRWDRVGYVSTPKGSMEHVGNVAFTTECMASQQDACLATMSHEFAHSWFGNLITCSSSLDMWINEGGASFCEEVAMQALGGTTNTLRGRNYARSNLRNVLMRAHIDDNGFKPVYGQEPAYTYGTTVYKKGATVWHSLRGYMGEELFYSSMKRLFKNHAFKSIDSRQLCDSLSLYSGIDLSGFFAFHVFSPGFVDYEIDSLSSSRSGAMVYIRQKSYGTDSLMQSNRVNVTFFADDLRSLKRQVRFDGEHAAVPVQLPFKPAFAIVDFDDELSKASLGQYAILSETGEKDYGEVFFKANVTQSDTWSWLYVKHHWTSLDANGQPWITKMASRHWTVTGVLPEDKPIDGYFYYSRSGSDGTLDNQFIASGSQLASVRLLYRQDVGHDWQQLPFEYSGSNSYGYFITHNLRAGQYALALVDTTHVGIDVAEVAKHDDVRIYPNPSRGTLTIETSNPGEELRVDAVDMKGDKILSHAAVRSGEQLSTPFPSGIYILYVFRPDGSEIGRSKIQIMNF
ncbi:MAG: T9SS type A sorting domain-containing protein [Bacteroidales bacterium]|nr:T9SS type A sorting domain-containing protein [Bacteroidales bacterium]